MDGRQDRRNKATVSNFSGLVWTAPDTSPRPQLIYYAAYFMAEKSNMRAQSLNEFLRGK